MCVDAARPTLELFREGKGQQEIVNRQLLFELALQPLLVFVILAMGAVAIPTGVRHKDLPVTGGALCLHAQAVRGAAGLHGSQCAPMTRQDHIPVLRQKPGLEGLDER